MASPFIVSSTIPLHLQELFDTMDLIASAKKGSKLCFIGKCYVDASSWSGAIYRKYTGESQSSKGNDLIRKCCDQAAQAFEQYKGDRLSDIILEKILKLRGGICVLKSNYEHDVSIVNHLNNSILFLDLVIPEDIKNKVLRGQSHINIVRSRNVSSSSGHSEEELPILEESSSEP